MFFLAMLWSLVRRRWVRRVLFWLVVRLIRWFGWRRSVRLMLRVPWRVLLLGAWRAAVKLLRAGAAGLPLLGWSRGDAMRVLRRSATSRLARRRDRIRRSVLAAVGVDPNWRPASRRQLGDAAAARQRNRPELGASQAR